MSNTLALSYIAGGLADLGAGYAGMRVGEARAGYQKVAAGINRQNVGLMASDVRERGEAAARKLMGQGRRLKGSQRAALAAQGVDVNSGSAADVQVDTETQVALDANEIRSNAWRQAWGMEAQADNDYSAAMMNANATQYDAQMTMLTGGMRFVNSGLQAYGAMDRKSTAPKGTVAGAY